MKKLGVIVASALVGVGVLGGAVMNFNSNANEVVKSDSLYEDYENRFEMEVQDMENMVPVFAAVGARINSEKDVYAATDEFVADAMSNLAFYAKDNLEGRFVEDADNIYVGKDTFEQLAKTAFYNYDITKNKVLTYNENTDSYTIKKDEANKKYKATVLSVVNVDGCKDGDFYNTYEVVVKVEKGLFTNVVMKFILEDNEYVADCDDYMFKYAVTDVEICK
jgi:hypothetical protein